MPAQFDINWTARLSSVSAAVSPGVVAIIAPDGTYLPATAANVAAGTVTLAAGVFLDSAIAGQQAGIQQSGIVHNEVSGLGAGTKSAVIADPTTARMVRKASPSGSDVVIGTANERGDVTITTGTSVTFATDISGTSTSQNVVGIRNIPVAAGTPSLGQSLVFVGGNYAPTTSAVAPFNAKLQYAATPDGVTNNATAFANAATAAGATGQVYLQAAGGAYRVSSNLTLASGLWVQNGATISVDAGVTLTINGALTADDYQNCFTGAGTVVLLGNGEILATWFGADPTGTNPSDVAGNAMYRSAVATQRTTDAGLVIQPPGMRWPAGAYTLNAPLQRYQGMHEYGDGASSTVIRWATFHEGPLMTYSLPRGSFPVATSLATGVGNAWNLDYAPSGGSSSGNTLLASLDCTSLTETYLTPTRMASWTVAFFYKFTGTPSNSYPLFFYGGDLTSDDAGTGSWPIRIYLGSDGRIFGFFSTSAGQVTVTHPTFLAAGTTYHVAVTWDGSTVSIYVGTPGSTNSRNTVAMAGTFTAKHYFFCTIGASRTRFPGTQVGGTSFGTIDSVVFRSGLTWTGASFTCPTAKHTANGSELYSTNFELAGTNSDLVVARGVQPNVYTPIQQGSTVPAGYSEHCEVHDIQFRGGSLWIDRMTNARTYRLVFDSLPNGPYFSNSYEGDFSHIQVKSAQHFGVSVWGATGVVNMTSVSTTATGYGLLLQDSGIVLTNCYPQSTKHVGVCVRSAGESVTVVANNLAPTDEGSTSYDAALLLDGKMSFTMVGGTLAATQTATPLCWISGTGTEDARPRASFNGTAFVTAPATAVFKFITANAYDGQVTVLTDPKFDANARVWGTGTAYTNNPNAILLPTRRRSGTVTIGGAATSATVTFTTAEADALYRVTGLVPAAASGTPTMAFAYPSSLGTSGFTVNVATAPGVGNSVTVTWAIER